MTDEERLARSALERALAENIVANPHAPIHMGRTTTFMGQTLQALMMMRPCRCGAHLAQAHFLGASPETAMREARKFVEVLIKKDE